MADANVLDPDEQDLLTRSAPAPPPQAPQTPSGAAPGATPGAPAATMSLTQTLASPGMGNAPLLYGLKTGVRTFGVGAHNVVDGLNDMVSTGEGGREKIRGAAKILQGIFQMGLSPLTIPAANLGKALELAAPELAAHEIAGGRTAGVIHTMLDPFGAAATMLESPTSIAKMSPEKLAAFRAQAEAYSQPFTFKDALETGAQMALAMALTNLKPAKESKPTGKKSSGQPSTDRSPVTTERPTLMTSETRPLYEMSRAELRSLEQTLLADEKAAAIEVFGPEQAKVYERLQRDANSQNTTKADAAYDKIREMESRLNEAQQQRLFGLGETGPNAEQARTFRQALDRLDMSSAIELGRSLRWAVSRLGEGDPVTETQRIAHAQMREGFRIAQEMDYDTSVVSAEAIRAAGTRFSPEDAAMMLRRFIRPEAGKPQPALPEAPATFLGYQEQVKGDPVSLYNLTEEVKGRPVGDTVTGDTLREMGFEPPKPVTPEQVSSFAQKMAQEEPVPPAGTQGPRIFGVNWQRLGQEESVNRVILQINKDLAEQGRMPPTEGAVKPTTAADIKARATAFGVTLEDVMRLPDLPARLKSVEDFDAFTTGVRGVRDLIANRLTAEAKMAVAGDPVARENMPPLMALASQAALADKLTGENIAQALQARANLSDITTSGTPVGRLMDLVQRLGGMTDIDKAADMITRLTKEEPRWQFLRNVGEAARRGKDIVWELYVNSLLSGPRTVVKKVLSDALRVGWELPERAIARWNHLLFFPSDPLGVAAGEAKAMARGLGQGIADAIRYAAHEDVDLGTGLGETHQFPKAVTAENLGLDPGSHVGKAVDALGNIARFPGTVIGVATKGAQIASFQIEGRAQAVRLAAWEGRTGPAFVDRVHYIETHLGEFPQVADAAHTASLVNTFTQELGPAGKAILGALNAVHLRGQVPFLKIPWNLTKFAVQTVPPFNVPSLLWGELNQAIHAGGASRELALAQVEMGAAVTAAVAYYVANGQISGGGPRDASLRETRRALGIPPYSIKVGDTWYRYNVVEPVGGMIGMTADLAETWAQLPADGEMADRVYQTGAMIAIAAGRTISEKPFFSGIKDVVTAIEQPDHRANTIAKGWARSTIPSLIRVTNQAYFDRVMHEVRGPLDAIKANTPGYSQTLPPHRNPITGTPVEFPPALGPDIASPIAMVEERPDPVFQMLLDNQIKVRAVPWVMDGHAPATVPMTSAQANAGLQLTPGQRDRWVVLMTSETINGRTLYGSLESLLTNSRFQNASHGPQSGKEALVQEQVHLYREMARLRLLSEDPDLRLTLMNRQREHLRLKLLPTTDVRSPQYGGGALSIGR